MSKARTFADPHRPRASGVDRLHADRAFPVFLTIINSFKDATRSSAAAAGADALDLQPHRLSDGARPRAISSHYFQNSFIVTVVSIVLVLLFGAMAAFALSRISLPRQYADGALHGDRDHDPDPPWHGRHPAGHGRGGPRQHVDRADPRLYGPGHAACDLHPVGIHADVSDDLKNAGRIDGLSEYAIFFRLVLPLVRPAMATVAVFTMIPIWNDLWFPLILAPSKPPRP